MLRLWSEPVPLALEAPDPPSNASIEPEEIESAALPDCPEAGAIEDQREDDTEPITSDIPVPDGSCERRVADETDSPEPLNPGWIDDPDFVVPAFVADTSQGTGESTSIPWPPALAPEREETGGPRLPSIRDILADHTGSSGSIPAGRTATVARRVPELTRGQRPAGVHVPSWLALPISGVGCLVVLAAGLGLGSIQAIDDKEAGLLANALVGGPTLPPRPPYRPGAAPPPTTWWRTSARRLFLEALAESRLPASPERDARVTAHLDAARRIAPLDPPTRLALAEASDGQALGLPVDLIAARVTGRRLLEAGRIEPALGVYRKAFELLATAEPEEASWPAFDEDAGVRRFHLPDEDLAADLLADLLDAKDVTLDEAQLLELIPGHPVLRMAAGRLLRERGRPEADAMLTWVRDFTPPAPDSNPLDGSLALAAKAEALALDDRLENAAEAYEKAVELTPAARLRRCWALNLAEIEARLDHREARDQAWDQARGTDPRDPVNLRLGEARQRHGGSPMTAAALGRPPLRDEALLRASGP